MIKNNKFLFTLALTAVASLAMQSCSDEESTDIKGSSIDILYDGKTVSDVLEFSMGGSFQMLAVHCDGDWTASIDDEGIEYNPADSAQANDLTRWIYLSNHAGFPDKTDNEGNFMDYSWIKVQFKYNESVDRTAHITFKTGDLSKTIAITQQGAGADVGDFFETAYQFRNNITIGYNLGNTLDSDPELTTSTKKWFKNWKDDLAWETVWGQPKTTQELIDEIVGKGFDVIRVPVTWFPHFDIQEDGTVVVREVWMNRVKEVVDYVINSGAYCILNVQHDSGASNGRTDGAGWLKANLDEYPATSIRYKSLWKQIAEEFKDYDHHLLFEAFNEILDEDDEWGDPSKETAYTAISKLEQDFVDVVRATGSNNEYRNLVINTYGAGHSAAKLEGMKIPNDVHRAHIIASIHSYDPYNFCNNNDEWNIYMFDDNCKKEIDDMFTMIHNRFNYLGVPYFYGEFGAIDEDKDTGERVKYAQYMVQKFQAFETKGLWWMGLIDRAEMDWYDSEIVDAITAPYKK